MDFQKRVESMLVGESMFSSDKELRDKAVQLIGLGIRQLIELGYGDRIVREAVKSILFKELSKHETV